MPKKNFSSPDEIKTSPQAKTEIVSTSEGVVMRLTFEPGWKWSEHIKPMAGTDSCQMHHVLIGLAGTLHVAMDDGTELDFGPGDVADILPGHDAWVVGDEQAIAIDIAGARN